MSAPSYPRALAAYQAGAWAEAERILRSIVAADARNVEALQLLGATRRAQGDLDGAEAILRQAVAKAPGNAEVLSSLGNVLLAQANYDGARVALDAALKIDPKLPWALQAKGNLLTIEGDLEAARALLERALAASPGHPHMLASLAALAEKAGRYDESERLAEQALAAAPRLGGAHLTLAEARLQRGEPQRAIDELTPVLDALAPAQRVHGLGLIGRAEEKLGRYDQAFASFTAANKIRADREAAPHLDAPSGSSPRSIARLTEFIRGADPRRWSVAPDADRSPVILTGFPRSATTLLEQALASHPDVEALDERQTIEDALCPLVLDEHAFNRWAALASEEIAAYRAAYWRSVDHYLGRPLARPAFVDKQPLAAAQLPEIHRIFPKAKIIFALRDPRDVVLSCFQQNFVLNPAMVNFLTLEGAARYYDAVMTLADLSRARLPLDLHVIRYPDLVADFRGEMQKLIAFLGLSWNESVLRYAETSKTRRVKTPSAAQVQKPIYANALDRWRRYEEQLKPVLPILAPWVARFGFAAA